MMTGTQESGYAGQKTPNDGSGLFNAVNFIIAQVLARIATATIVRVEAIDAEAQTVSVQPMVKMIDGAGETSQHGVITGVPYFRVQGGTAAVILDPKVGDLGIAIFASRDISAVKSTKQVSPPGSLRKFDMADGVYVGGVLNGTPEMWVRFTDEGIDVKAPKVTIEAAETNVEGTLNVDGNVTIEGNVLVDGDVVSSDGGESPISLRYHIHPRV